ncbi:MAG: heme oxygenase (biliverdin-producing), partial [Microthrixaceae bacterium]
GPFVFDELTRLPSIETDLEVLVGAEWPESIRALPATRLYVERMEEVCFGWPGGFVAHHYTRYLGDLSGGLIIGRTVKDQFGLRDGGATFYEFPRIPDAAAFKDGYRRLLDALRWPSEERSKVIDEVRRAYALNFQMLRAIGSPMTG